jgi:deazaflavin-dependent oxidoreductase (nitroreductase family)
VAVKLAPRGTRGFVMPRAARPLAKAGMKLSHFMYRYMGDRMKVQGRPLLELNTVGAKSGVPRHATLARFDDPTQPGSMLIIGSNNGAAEHPSWCYNLVKNPDQVSVTMGKQKVMVHPDSLEGEERDAAWNMVVALAPRYGKYEHTTDRRIPVIRLTPKGDVA